MVIDIESLVPNFAMKVKIERIKRNWSQEELAEYSELHRTTISAIERKKMIPTIDTVTRLCNAFNIEIADIFKFNF